jgi:hypothetical protein
LTFFVADRFVKDDASGIDLVAHAANSEAFTYSLPHVEGGPWTLAFARPRSAFSGAAKDGSTDKDVAPGFVPGDWRARREDEFQRYLDGKRGVVRSE